MILNCIIRDSWTRTVAADALLAKEPLISMETSGSTFLIRSHDATGVYEQYEVQQQSHRYIPLKKSRLIWIRSNPGKANVQPLIMIAESLGIPHKVAYVMARKTRESKSFKISWGIIVDITLATDFLLAWKPELLEMKRARIYNNDDH